LGAGVIAKEAVMVKCPVCNMDVDPKKSTNKLERDGKTLHFCGEGCNAKYKAEPHKYAKASK
jgi:Cu+-exporting ATPase